MYPVCHRCYLTFLNPSLATCSDFYIENVFEELDAPGEVWKLSFYSRRPLVFS